MREHLVGGCLCGKIRYELLVEPVMTATCYCRDCQRAGSSESVHSIGLPINGLRFTQGTPKYFELAADSGKAVRRGFCGDCGSQLVAYPQAYPDSMSVRVCSLDDPSRFKPQFAIYTASAQPWTRLPTDIPTFSKTPQSKEEALQIARNLQH